MVGHGHGQTPNDGRAIEQYLMPSEANSFFVGPIPALGVAVPSRVDQTDAAATPRLIIALDCRLEQARIYFSWASVSSPFCKLDHSTTALYVETTVGASVSPVLRA